MQSPRGMSCDTMSTRQGCTKCGTQTSQDMRQVNSARLQTHTRSAFRSVLQTRAWPQTIKGIAGQSVMMHALSLLHCIYVEEPCLRGLYE